MEEGGKKNMDDIAVRLSQLFDRTECLRETELTGGILGPLERAVRDRLQ